MIISGSTRLQLQRLTRVTKIVTIQLHIMECVGKPWGEVQRFGCEYKLTE
jgi:hypothetical protein